MYHLGMKAPQSLSAGDIQAQLWTAIAKGEKDKVRMMLAAGADVNMLDADGRTALHIASQYGQADIYKTLLSAREMQAFKSQVRAA